MNAPRAILHVDMDAFYASVEQHDHPELRGRPLIVGGTSGRGVVAAASYEVRRFGVYSAMPIGQALRLCPDAICVRPRMARYREASGIVFDIFGRFTPLVEGLSLDEAFLDVTGSERLHGTAPVIAASIKRQIHERTGLTASVGVATNKLVAKIASDLAKPDGLTVISADRIVEMLDPLSIKRLPGLGRKKGDQVIAAGITTLGALRRASDASLRALFGRDAARMRERAAGIDERPVVADREEKSVSAEETFATDLADPDEMRAQVLQLADRASARLRAQHIASSCVTVKIRRHDFSTFTRQRGFSPATNDSRAIAAIAIELLNEWLATARGARVRLLGVGTSQLDASVQEDLFDLPAQIGAAPLDQAIDSIRSKFGGDALARASSLRRRKDGGAGPFTP